MAFGDGSDGDVTISVDTTLTADMNYNNLTVNAGITLYPDGYVIYVKETLTLNGTINRNGNDGLNCECYDAGGPDWWYYDCWSNGGGAALPTRSLGGSGAGGVGGGGGGDGPPNQYYCTTGSPGSSVEGIADSSGGIGGNNTGASPKCSPGSGGTTTTAYIVDCQDIDDIITNAATRLGGPGGGGGGGSAGGAGGGGGSGGGVVYISAKSISGNGIISANGGNGYGCTYATGGGGGGGAIIIEYDIKDNFTGTVTVNGGSGYQSGTVGAITYCLVARTISGNVTNSDGFNLLDIKIAFENTTDYETSTNANGNYSQVVDPDVYTVTALLPGSDDISDTVDASTASKTKDFVFPITTAPHDKTIRLKERYLLE